MKGKIHHLIHIHELKNLGSIYYLGCGRKYKLKDNGLPSCSHISMVDCESCKKAYEKKWKHNKKIIQFQKEES